MEWTRSDVLAATELFDAVFLIIDEWANAHYY